VAGAVLVVLGFVAVVGGVFPLAGLVGLLVGIGMEVRVFFARRTRPATA